MWTVFGVKSEVRVWSGFFTELYSLYGICFWFKIVFRAEYVF